MSANVVIVVDSSDSDEQTVSQPVGGRSAPLRVSSSDDDSNDRPSQAKRPRVEPPAVASVSPGTPKAVKGLTYSSSSDGIASTDELEDDSDNHKKPVTTPSKKSVKAPVKRKSVKKKAEDSDANMSSEDDQMDVASTLRFARRDGRMYSDVLSFSELQAQQRELERLQARAHRKNNASSPRTSKPAARRAVSQSKIAGMKRKATTSFSIEHGTPHSKSVVMRKSASPSPFDFDFPGSNDDDSSASASSPEGTRTSAPGAHAKPMSLKDVVAQERELARVRKQSVQRSNSKESSRKTTKAKEKPLFSFKTQTNDNLIDGTGWSDDSDTDNNDGHDDDNTVKEQEPAPAPEFSSSESEEKASSDDEDFIPSSPKQSEPQATPSTVTKTKTAETGKTGKRKKGAKKTSSTGRSKRSQMSRSSSSKADARPATSEPASAIVDAPAKRRDATDTVMPTTVWRNICVEVAPPNLLPLDSSIAPHCLFESEQSLLHYDEDGDLRSKCKLLPQFGKAAQLMSSQLLNDESEQVSQEEMDNKVTEVIQRELPRIRACHERKTSAIIAEGRKKVKAYLAAQKRGQDERITLHCKPLSEVSILDKTLLNQMKQEKPTQTVAMGYANVWGETFSMKEHIFPANVNQLPSIRPLSRCMTFIGVKANVRVEDDPILRYKPYFGEDDDGEDIDVNWYDAVVSSDSNQSIGSDGEVNEYLLRLVVRELGTSEKVFTALKKVPGFTQPYSDYSDIKKQDESVRLAARRIREAKQLIAEKTDQFPLSKVATLEPLLGNVKDTQITLAERFASPPTFFDSNLARCHNDRGYGLGLRPSKDYTELLVTYRDMFCRMCYVHHCLEHGIQHPLPSHRVDPINPPLHLSAVALAAKIRQEELHESDGSRNQTPDSNSPAVSPPGESSASTAGDHEKGYESHSHSEGVHTDEDSSTRPALEGSYDTATDEDASATSEARETRRSSRSATRISTLASRSLKKQVRPSRRKPSQTHRAKIYPKVADKSEYLDDSHVAWVKSVVKKSLDADERCSNECSKAVDKAASDKDDTMNSVKLLSETELVLLRKLRTVIGDNPCMISAMVKSTTCKEVGAFLESERLSKPVRTNSMDDAAFSPDGKSSLHGRKRHASRNSSNRILLNRTRNNRLKDKGTNHEYEPCNHDGACNSTECSCMSRDHTCEKACSCSRDCPNRFPGCKCSLGNCRTKACPCFVAGRECNPDLCFTCGASEVPALIFDEERKNMSALELGICCNVNILRGLHKKVGVSYSTTHGWGAFALEPIKRGEFIYEYHGALLSQDEAERRGSIYDKMTISFLFDADDDSVVDAIRKGNKSKFANHLAVGQKCKGKVLTVGGEHRISIWAQQDIEKGEELFFDYGYHGETAPDWSQLRIKGSSRNKSQKKEQQAKKEKH